MATPSSLSLLNSNLTDDEFLSLLRNSGLQYNISAALSGHSHPSSSSPTASFCYQSPTLELISAPTPQLLLFLLYSLTSLLSVSGNALVLLVHLTSRQGGRLGGGNMRRYLNNLAVSDITLALLSMPFTYTNLVLGHWTFPGWLCPAAQFAQLLSVFTTSTTLTIIGIERYCVVLHPFSASSLWLTSHTTTLIVATWALGALYSYLPTRAIQTTQFLHHFTAYTQCSYRREEGNGRTKGYSDSSAPADTDRALNLYVVANFTLTFLIPLLTILATYGAIIRKLRRTGNFIAKFVSPSSQKCAWIFIVQPNEVTNPQKTRPIVAIDERSKTIKMILIVIVAYCLSWAPIKVFQFLLFKGVLGLCSEVQFYLVNYTYIACHWLAMANSAVNPIIFSFMSKKFRNDFCLLFQSLRKRISLSKLKQTLSCAASVIEMGDS